MTNWKISSNRLEKIQIYFLVNSNRFKHFYYKIMPKNICFQPLKNRGCYPYLSNHHEILALFARNNLQFVSLKNFNFNPRYLKKTFFGG
ncbi:hypothetical protein TSAR_000812 [Trichomalopsis sarcophagae]|uniref:Uncharacterized protein n=1 Tax=Trichomalopsis sarcophagae TaxID=543379 RepID=A0A232FL50_9HYME|nr:hypothetical protein TSAR_000812 [Trichomalopsis sarcophagae]